jgi:hypothetical protein
MGICWGERAALIVGPSAGAAVVRVVKRPAVAGVISECMYDQRKMGLTSEAVGDGLHGRCLAWGEMVGCSMNDGLLVSSKKMACCLVIE